MRRTDRLRAWSVTSPSLSLHAGVVIADHNREALERVARFGARPAFAHDRLTWTSDGRISYKLKRPWPDGRTHLVSEPVALLRRLIGIIPGRDAIWFATLACSAPPAKLARTWSDLIPWPALGCDADAKTFIDQLAANTVSAQTPADLVAR